MTEQATTPRRAKPYSTDLTDKEWQILGPHLPPPKRLGRPRQVELREVVNAILYQTKNNCTWADLPRDFPPKSTVQDYYYAWIGDGSWQRWLGLLRQQVRVEAGHEPTPSAGCIDSQSVPSSHVGGRKGVDGGKKVKGRKRHIAVDTLGLLIAVAVTPAHWADGPAACNVLAQLTWAAFPRLRVLYGDARYCGPVLEAWLRRHGWYRVEVVQRPEGVKGFVPLPKRWVVERTFAWLLRYRRLDREWEYHAASSEARVQIACIHLMRRRLARRRPIETGGVRKVA